MKGVRKRLWLLCGLSLACGDATDPGVEPPAGSLVPLDVRVAPVVAANGEPFVLELRLADPAGPVIHVLPREPLGLTRAGELLDSLILRDDGVPPDRQAGDGWYAAGDLVLEAGEGGVASRSLGPIRSIHEPGGVPRDTVIHVWVPFRAVDTTVVPLPVVMTLDERLLSTSQVVNLVRPEGGEYATIEFAAEVARSYYEWFPDDRDFMALAVPPTVGPTWSAQAIHIRNHIDGLGFPTGEFRDFGSPGRLTLVVHLLLDFYSTGETGGSFCLLNHELSHRWVAYVGEPLTSSSSGGHWLTNVLERPTSVLGDSLGCIMNDLELYLAGLVPPDSVVGPLTEGGYGIENLVAATGERNPGWQESGSELTVAFVVVTTEPLDPAGLAYFQHVATEYAAEETDLGVNWRESSGSRSRLLPRLQRP